MVAKIDAISGSGNLIFNENISLEKNLKIVHEKDRLIFLMNDNELHTLPIIKISSIKLIKNRYDNYQLNSSKVHLIELFSEQILQFGLFGMSIYKNFEEFKKNTKKGFSKNDKFDFIQYQQ